MGLYASQQMAIHAARIDPKNFFAAYDPSPEKSAEYLNEKERQEAAERAAEQARRDHEARATNASAPPAEPVELPHSGFSLFGAGPFKTGRT